MISELVLYSYTYIYQYERAANVCANICIYTSISTNINRITSTCTDAANRILAFTSSIETHANATAANPNIDSSNVVG